MNWDFSGIKFTEIYKARMFYRFMQYIFQLIFQNEKNRMNS